MQGGKLIQMCGFVWIVQGSSRQFSELLLTWRPSSVWTNYSWLVHCEVGAEFDYVDTVERLWWFGGIGPARRLLLWLSHRRLEGQLLGQVIDHADLIKFCEPLAFRDNEALDHPSSLLHRRPLDHRWRKVAQLLGLRLHLDMVRRQLLVPIQTLHWLATLLSCRCCW